MVLTYYFLIESNTQVKLAYASVVPIIYFSHTLACNLRFTGIFYKHCKLSDDFGTFKMLQFSDYIEFYNYFTISYIYKCELFLLLGEHPHITSTSER